MNPYVEFWQIRCEIMNFDKLEITINIDDSAMRGFVDAANKAAEAVAAIDTTDLLRYAVYAPLVLLGHGTSVISQNLVATLAEDCYQREMDKLDAIFDFIFDPDDLTSEELDSELELLGYDPAQMAEDINGLVDGILGRKTTDVSTMSQREVVK